ncbi:MAG TPA: hypothetical protein ENJ95_16235 [Bacteroidetes bacterium]|nr:hypothetical protein [Bacteroidota bacterium]
MEIGINSIDCPYWLIKLTIVEGADYYMIVYGENYTPIMKQGKILIYSELVFLKALGIDSSELKKRIEVNMDIPKIFDSLISKGKDVDSMILNSYNLISDFILNNIPKIDEGRLNESFDILNPFADFLTFDTDFGDSYIRTECQRTEIYSALCYMFGHFLNYVVVVNEPVIASVHQSTNGQ